MPDEIRDGGLVGRPIIREMPGDVKLDANTGSAPPMFQFEREFQVWLYTVSHSILLLRSVKSETLSTRVDVIFKPVRALSVPTTLVGIDVRSMPVPATLAGVVPDLHDSDQFFSLTGAEPTWWIVAGTVDWHGDEGEYSDPSSFSVPRMVW